MTKVETIKKLEQQLAGEREAVKTQLLVDACEKAAQPATIRLRPGYDHSHYFISTFMAEHVAWHAERLSE